MTRGLPFRIETYKDCLRAVMSANKKIAFKEKLKALSVRELRVMAESYACGQSFSNVWRDVRRVTEPGRGYDAEFDFLWRGQAIPHIVADYTDTMLGTLIQGVVTPRDMDERFRSLQRRRPDGRAVYEEV